MAAKSVSCVVEHYAEKGKVVRYKGNAEMMSSGYFGKKALAKIGTPNRVKVTIEPAGDDE